VSEQPNSKPAHLDRLDNLWRRVFDRKLVQWSAAYIAVAYAVQHGVVLTSEAFEWPHAVQQASMLLLVLGLPLVVTFAWYHGERASRNFTQAEISILSSLLVVGSLLFYLFVRVEGDVSPRPPVPQPDGAISLAVLPFANLSGDASQEFFSDGMTEEITSALARVPDLRVVARTSAYEFKGKNIDIRTMGQQLGATHLIEGSVRKAGNRLRITAQLIKADDGTHIWAQDYDRQLTDIFQVQEDIARTIATSLRMPLGLKPGENLVANRAIDPESYGQFLHAKVLLRRAGFAAADALVILEPLVARSPNYAPAWEQLGLSYLFMTIGADSAQRATYIAKMEAAADRAVALDPKSSLGRAQQVYFKDVPRKWAIIEDAYADALSLDPYRPDMLQYSGDVFREVGRVKDALVKFRQLVEVEPLVPNSRAQYAQALWLDGQTDAAIKFLEDLGISTQGTLKDLAQYHASLGRYKEAADVIARVPQTGANAELLRTAASLLRSAPGKVQTPEKLPALGRLWGFIYLYIGVGERVLDSYEEEVTLTPAQIAYLWHPSYADVRKTERFKALVRKLRIVD